MAVALPMGTREYSGKDENLRRRYEVLNACEVAYREAVARKASTRELFEAYIKLQEALADVQAS